MKAIVLHAYGGPEQLKYEDWPDPACGPGYVLVRVAATSINPIDLKMRSGAVKDRFPLTFPTILGRDVSGTVEEVGTEVDGFVKGDGVFAQADLTYASLCCVKAEYLAKIPPGMNLVDVAALPTVTTTGAQLAALALQGTRGATMLVTGAAGNVGRSAVYAAKQQGATVVAGVRKQHAELARTLGADRVIPLDDEAAMKSLEPVDAVADTVGGAVAARVIGALKVHGVFASVLGPPGNAAAYPKVTITSMQVQPHVPTLLEMARAVQTGTLSIPLGPRFALKDANAAHAADENGVPGKVLLLA